MGSFSVRTEKAGGEAPRPSQGSPPSPAGVSTSRAEQSSWFVLHMSVSPGAVCCDHLGSFKLVVMTGPRPLKSGMQSGWDQVGLPGEHVTGHSRDLELSSQLQPAVFFLCLVLLLLFN